MAEAMVEIFSKTGEILTDKGGAILGDTCKQMCRIL